MNKSNKEPILLNVEQNSGKVKIDVKTPKKPAIKAVASGSRGRKTLATRTKDLFLGDDGEGVGTYILHDVVLPLIKNALYEGVMGSLNMTLFDKGTPPRQSGRRGGQSYYNYNGVGRNVYSSEPTYGRTRDERPQRRERVSLDFDHIEFETRAEAEHVIQTMGDILEQYEVVSVSDLYELSNLTPMRLDYDWGWDNIDEAFSSQVRGGRYIIRLPKPRLIK